MPTFTKQERLKSRKTIGQLFKGGNSFVAYPLRVVWLAPPSPPGGGENVAPSTLEKRIEGESVAPISFRRKTGSEAFSPPPGGLGGAQIAITVPKKNFKTAVARNRIKRLIREAYRLHKQELYEKLSSRSVALMLMYIAKEELSYSEIEAGMKKMIRKFPV